MNFFLSDEGSPEENFSTVQKIEKGLHSPLNKIVPELNFPLTSFKRSRAILDHHPSNKCITECWEHDVLQFTTVVLCKCNEAMGEVINTEKKKKSKIPCSWKNTCRGRGSVLRWWPKQPMHIKNEEKAKGGPPETLQRKISPVLCDRIWMHW